MVVFFPDVAGLGSSPREKHRPSALIDGQWSSTMIGSELRSILRADLQRALSIAVHVLIDELLADIVDLQRGEPFANMGMAAYVPSTFRHRYDPLFATRFLACVYTVA